MPAVTRDFGTGAPPVDEATAVRAHPVVVARWAVVGAVAVLILFVAIALVMRGSESAGAPFTSADQVATGVIGLFAAAGVLLLTRPRLVADRHGFRTKAWAGRYRYVPWDVVVDIRFPAGARFARLVLPGEEYLSLYAVHRWDGDRAVATMTQLRQLQAQVRSPRAAA
ncbi:PH domain-containing protein [Jatrophihabitans sp. YIM 134969]